MPLFYYRGLRGSGTITRMGDLERYRSEGGRLLKLGEPLLAYDVIAEGVKEFAADVELRQLLALSLARSGAAVAANKLLTELYTEGHRDEETLGILARTHKDLASEAAEAAETQHHHRRAYEYYRQAYDASGGYWSGINAATLALLLGDSAQAQVIAREVIDQCSAKLKHAQESDKYWLLSTLAEAELVLRNWSAAQHWYGKAVEIGFGNWGNLQSTKRNALLLARHWALDHTALDQLFNIPSVVVFTGHMIDRPDRAPPRFPPRLEQAVKESIRQRLHQLNAGFAYASAACGADILFHEVMLERNGECHVVLPYPKELFIKDSVDYVGDSGWIRRFENVLSRSVEVLEASGQTTRPGAVLYEFANLMLHGLAAMKAEQLQTTLVPMAVWDGKAGDGGGGTGATVEYWRRRGLEVEVIDVAAGVDPHPALRAPVSQAERDFRQEIRALLFADAEGFSRLNDEEVPKFVEHFLGLVGRLAEKYGQEVLMKNTWGDGLFFVFENVGQAGKFAIELRDSVRAKDWASEGLPNINLRIALHAGPVYACIDPVIMRTNYIGPHVSRAARMEPVTPGGQVYASQPFAALTAATGVTEIRCDYVGQTAMAKKYGTFPAYVVLNRGVRG
jgi:class 3 adenylate cyclase